MLSKLLPLFGISIPIGLLGSFWLYREWHTSSEPQSWEMAVGGMVIISIPPCVAVATSILGYYTNHALCNNQWISPWSGNFASLLLGTALNALPVGSFLWSFTRNPVRRYFAEFGVSMILSLFGISVMAPTIFKLIYILSSDYAVLRCLLALTFVNWLCNRDQDYEDQTYNIYELI